ncbi:DUF2157 domain-containing protein [Aneurinibacillus danicus]|uniref:DUF2157 domain-containing protein n=1 Tax=Aneurinibacillus danicus TaxID=267746 RepID=A0A511V7A9_9BACL|nr:DUF2157 domain-containing protein [Aneurinibacillus danicus]GEN33818.1 hypothetical protein ADA01nite_12780 [Aneurinibacillus danicus]
MSRKWVEEEGRHWVDRGIISEEQYGQIVALYPHKKIVSERLPIFAAILVGAGILTFIASNWSAIPQLIRLLMILFAMGGFYWFGYRKEKRGAQALGLSLIALGIITFGAGIFLIGQMFHLVAYDARAFIIWSLPAIALVWMYRSRWLYFLALFIVDAGQVYSAISFQQVSWLLLVLLLLGTGGYTLRHSGRAVFASLVSSILLHSLLYLITESQAIGWLALIAAALYAALDWLPNRRTRMAGQLAALVSAFFLAVFFIFLLGEMDREPVPNPAVFLVLFAFTFALSFFGKRKHKETVALLEWFIFLPFFYWESAGDVMYLLVLFVFSGYLLWIGYREEGSGRVNAGTLLFLLSTFIGYIQVAWDFLPKSLFFLVGGLLLFALNWFLQRQRRKLLEGNGRGGGRT